MTVSDMYRKTKLWMFEKVSSTIYDNYIVEICNKVLAETYDENNMRRMYKGKAPFTDGVEAHQVSQLADDLDYEEEYLYDVIPKGIDANFLMDDDLTKMTILQTEYNNARVKYLSVVSNKKIKELTESAQ